MARKFKFLEVKIPYIFGAKIQIFKIQNELNFWCQNSNILNSEWIQFLAPKFKFLPGEIIPIFCANIQIFGSQNNFYFWRVNSNVFLRNVKFKLGNKKTCKKCQWLELDHPGWSWWWWSLKWIQVWKNSFLTECLEKNLLEFLWHIE